MCAHVKDRLDFLAWDKRRGLCKGRCQRAFADRPVVSERLEPERPASPRPSICTPILSVASHDELTPINTLAISGLKRRKPCPFDWFMSHRHASPQGRRRRICPFWAVVRRHRLHRSPTLRLRRRPVHGTKRGTTLETQGGCGTGHAERVTPR